MPALFRVAAKLARQLVLAALACLVAPIPGFAQPPFAGSCAEDEKIDAAKRGPIEDAASRFIQHILSGDGVSAYGQLSTEARASLGHLEFLTAAQQIQGLGPFKDLRIGPVYFVRLTGGSPLRVVCGKDISRPQGWVSVAAKDIPEQAHVLLEAQALNNAWTFTIWLIPEQAQWRVQYFHANASTLADKSIEDLWTLARTENERGHNFNAVVLYAAVLQLASRGPNFQLGVQQAIQEEAQQITAPEDMQGPPPFAWLAKERTFRILQVGPIAVGGKIYVMLMHEVEPWKDEAQVESWNRELIRYFSARFPEYSEVFAGTVVQARERGGTRAFGTVEELNQ